MATDRPILLIEDNADDETLTLRAFDRHHIKNDVVVTRTGTEALDYLFGEGRYAKRDVSLQPAVIFLDLKLPRMDGLEVLRRIRANELTSFLPVVVLTTSREPQDIHQSYVLGANSYVRKPVDFEQFLLTVGRLAEYWLHLNELSGRLP